jgi:hypothetical protein
MEEASTHLKISFPLSGFLPLDQRQSLSNIRQAIVAICLEFFKPQSSGFAMNKTKNREV